MVEHAPVITSLNEDQIKSFTDFIEVLRTDNTVAAKAETTRLRPYFNALSAQLTVDAGASEKNTDDLAPLSRKGGLSRLFNAIAQRTKNTILSEIILVPEALLQNDAATKNNTQFNAHMSYDGTSFTFGFLQTFDENKTSSVSIPLLGLNTDKMASIESFHPGEFLQALQAVATAGNHDMLHHYTNTVLNNSIARPNLDGSLSKPVLTAMNWFNHYFNYNRDSDVNSYESWLMLDHMRVRRIMEEGPEGKALESACNKFFDELSRIGKEMTEASSKEEAHKAVDYFGSMLLFTMMRFMPLDHPLMEHAVERLQQADPDPAALEEKKDALVDFANSHIDYVGQTISNYKAAGLDILPDNVAYADLKRIQLISIAPWITHLISPAQPETLLAEMQSQARVGGANIDMVRDSAAGIWFNMKNGGHRLIRPDGTEIDVYLNKGLLDRKDEPALVEISPDGTKTEKWYSKGKVYRTATLKEDGEYHEKWYRDGDKHRDDGPAVIDRLPNGSSNEEWYQNGRKHREGGPAHTEINDKGVKEIEWYVEGKRHREDGPATLKTASNGKILLESWWKNDVRHRDDGPSSIEKGLDGSSKEEWMVNGRYHRLDGPAVTEVSKDEIREEKWYKDGQLYHEDGPTHKRTSADGTVTKEVWLKDGSLHREDGPARFEKFPDGSHTSYTEEWFANNEHHRLDGPAVIEVSADGSKKESWEQNGVAHRLDGPSYIDTAADGTVMIERWRKKGIQHREDGPAVTKRSPDGAYEEEWYVNGEHSRKDGPALIEISANGSKKESWEQNGISHRLDGPSYIETAADGTVLSELWWKNGIQHCENGPAVIKKYPNGAYEEEWVVNGKHHRLDGPAEIEISANGIKEETWYKNGKWHRKDGPAYVETDVSGSVTKEVWWKNGLQHRDDGPAYVEISPDGSRTEKWFKNGQEIEPPANKPSTKISRRSKKSAPEPI